MELRDALTQISGDPPADGADRGIPGHQGDAGRLFQGCSPWRPQGFRWSGSATRIRSWRAISVSRIGAAVISAVAAGAEMMIRVRNSASPWTREITWLAVEQFIPCLVAGACSPSCWSGSPPNRVWMLTRTVADPLQPGSVRLVPPLASRHVRGGGLYLATGLACLALARGEYALSPWAMGLPFGIGQLLAAAVLYRTLECRDA